MSNITMSSRDNGMRPRPTPPPSPDQQYARVACRLTELLCTCGDVPAATKSRLDAGTAEENVRFLLMALSLRSVRQARPSLPVTGADIVRASALAHKPGVRAVERARRLLETLVSRKCEAAERLNSTTDMNSTGEKS